MTNTFGGRSRTLVPANQREVFHNCAGSSNFRLQSCDILVTAFGQFKRHYAGKLGLRAGELSAPANGIGRVIRRRLKEPSILSELRLEWWKMLTIEQVDPSNESA